MLDKIVSTSTIIMDDRKVRILQITHQLQKNLTQFLLVSLGLHELLLRHFNTQFEHALQDVCTLQDGKGKLGTARIRCQVHDQS
jgi:hypothetical protein